MTEQETVVVLDGVELQAALRAALAVAPTKGEHSVVAVRLPAAGGLSAASVCAYDPERSMSVSVSVATSHTKLADDRDQVVELTPPSARQLLAMKIKPPAEDDPWPFVSWAISESRVTQADDGQLFGRMSRVLREDRDRPTLGDIPSRLAEQADRTPELTGISLLSPAQVKALGAVLSHLREPAHLHPQEPAEGQLAACMVMSQSLVAFCSTPDKEKATAEPTTPAPEPRDGVEISFDDARRRLNIVQTKPTGGIA